MFLRPDETTGTRGIKRKKSDYEEEYCEDIEKKFEKIDEELKLKEESPITIFPIKNDICYETVPNEENEILMDEILMDETGHPVMKEIFYEKREDIDTTKPMTLVISCHGAIPCTKIDGMEYNYIPNMTVVPDGMTVFKFTISTEGVINMASHLESKYYLSVIYQHINELNDLRTRQESFKEVIHKIEEINYEMNKVTKKQVFSNYNEILQNPIRKRYGIDVKPEDEDVHLKVDYIKYSHEGYNLFKLEEGDRIVNKVFLRKVKEKKKNNYSITELQEGLITEPINTISYNRVRIKPKTIGVPQEWQHDRPGFIPVKNKSTQKIEYRKFTLDEFHEFPDLINIIEPIHPPVDIDDKLQEMLNDPNFEIDDTMYSDEDKKKLDEYLESVSIYEYYEEKEQLITLDDMMKYYKHQGINTLIIFDFSCSTFVEQDNDRLIDMDKHQVELIREYMYQSHRCTGKEYPRLAYGGKNKSRKNKNKSRKNKNKSRKNKNKSRKNKNKSRKNK
jgi:hypothetical protein